jgi:hypothetical protein
MDARFSSKTSAHMPTTPLYIPQDINIHISVVSKVELENRGANRHADLVVNLPLGPLFSEIQVAVALKSPLSFIQYRDENFATIYPEHPCLNAIVFHYKCKNRSEFKVMLTE